MIKLMLLLALLGAILLHDSLAITSDQYSDKQSFSLLQRITKAYPNFIDLPYEDVVRYLALTRAELGITEVPPAKTETKSIQKQTEEDEQDKQDEMEAEEKAAAHVLAQAQAAAAALAQAEQAAVLKAKKEAGLFAPQTKALVEFVGMPEGAGRQRGSCDKILNNTPNVRWIHGKSNMQTGAMTLLLFMSQQCISCHDVAIKINSIYKTWRNRGLNVLAIHSSPKGYASSEEDLTLLKAFIEEEGIEFAIVDVASKEGQQPVLKSTGLPDWKRAARTPTGAASLYRYMFDEMEYAVPLAIIYKNCVPLMSDPLDGYHIMALDRSIAASEEVMLWPFGQVSDDAIQETGFQEAASQHGVAPEELEWEWDGDKEARAEAEAGGAPAGHEPVKRHGRRRKKQASRVSSTSADTGGGGGRKSSAGASRRTSRADPRDDRSHIVESNDEAEESEKEWQMQDDVHETKSEKKKRSESKVEMEVEVEVEGFAEADSLFDGAPPVDSASGAAKRKSRLAESRREVEEDEQAEEGARKPRSRGRRGFSRRGRG